MNNVFSMTAYARHQSPLQTDDIQGQYTWELRSVNQRYLEMNIKIPDVYRSLETQIRDVLKQHLSRGKIDISLSLIAQSQKSALKVDHQLLQQLKQSLADIQQHFPNAETPNPVDLLKWPGVLQNNEENINDSAMQQTLISGLETCISTLKAHRLREGQALAEIILQRCEQISTLLDKIEPLMPEIRQSHLQKLQERMATLLDNYDEQRLYQEAAILAQKIDIDEEIKRLRTHLTEVCFTLESQEPKGRRLDFLMQELNREANTLGSKSVDARTSQASVELKVFIEQIREQVQNIE